MSDVRDQVESVIAEFDNGWIGPKRAKALAAVLAEAGLLADRAYWDWLRDRAELAEMTRAYEMATKNAQAAIDKADRLYYRVAEAEAELYDWKQATVALLMEVGGTVTITGSTLRNLDPNSTVEVYDDLSTLNKVIRVRAPLGGDRG